jgi:two-component system, OmpR family, response regulator VicR
MTRILLLEDDPNLGAVLEEHLEMNGFAVRRCVNGEEGESAFRAAPYDLCLVDVMMPRKDGFTFARELRARDSRTPIIFLTAKALKEDRIEGLRIGADDYITKPFSMEELLLRINAVLRRTTPADTQGPAHIGSFLFDREKQELRRGGKVQKLTSRETDLLSLLTAHMNTTLDRDEALRQLWGSNTFFNGRSMDVFVSKLRKYLRGDPGVAIISVHGKGFRLVVKA